MSSSVTLHYSLFTTKCEDYASYMTLLALGAIDVYKMITTSYMRITRCTKCHKKVYGIVDIPLHCHVCMLRHCIRAMTKIESRIPLLEAAQDALVSKIVAFHLHTFDGYHVSAGRFYASSHISSIAEKWCEYTQCSYKPKMVQLFYNDTLLLHGFTLADYGIWTGCKIVVRVPTISISINDIILQPAVGEWWTVAQLKKCLMFNKFITSLDVALVNENDVELCDASRLLSEYQINILNKLKVKQ